MSVKIIQERLESYRCQSDMEEDHAIREISQEVVLAALSRTDFFKQASFQGGTCLRILYGLNRFSEDLDFILRDPDTAFKLDKYFKPVKQELESFGYDMEIVDRSESMNTVKKIFLKDNSAGNLLHLKYLNKKQPMRKVRIKLEVDTNPPSGGHFDLKYHDFPFAYSLTTQDLPTLFAGKLHALLCRAYVKGRDWYDLIWYLARKTKINFVFLASALEQQGPWKDTKINTNLDWCMTTLSEKISSLNWIKAKDDVRRFVRTNESASLDVWGKDFFLDRLERYGEKSVFLKSP